MADKFEQWAIVEIMGHQRYAGKVTEEVIAGAAFVRVDVPAIGGAPGNPAFTKFFGPQSIYSLTPVSEEVARGIAMHLLKEPVNVYELPEDLQQRLNFRHANDDRDDYEEDGS